MFGIKALKEEVKSLNQKIENYEHDTRDKNELQRKANDLGTDNIKLKEENHQLKTKIREQNEADIFFSCEKIQKKLLEGEPKESVSQDYAAIQRAYAQQQSVGYHGITNFLGALPSIFGNRAI